MVVLTVCGCMQIMATVPSIMILYDQGRIGKPFYQSLITAFLVFVFEALGSWCETHEGFIFIYSFVRNCTQRNQGAFVLNIGIRRNITIIMPHTLDISRRILNIPTWSFVLSTYSYCCLHASLQCPFAPLKRLPSHMYSAMHVFSV